MTADTLIKKASQAPTYFTAAQLAELKKILAHNDSAPRPKKVSGQQCAEHFGMTYETFLKRVRQTLGRSFGGTK
jgi:hypothetical protein